MATAPVSVLPVSGVSVVTVRGKIVVGSETMQELRMRLSELTEHGKVKWILNLQEVNMIDSSGIGLLTQALTSSKNHGGACKLAALQKYPQQMLKMVGLLPLFEVFESVDAAMASF